LPPTPKNQKNPMPVISIFYYSAYQLFFCFYNSLKINVLRKAERVYL
jgi:hypothetical protein